MKLNEAEVWNEGWVAGYHAGRAAAIEDWQADFTKNQVEIKVFDIEREED